LSSTVDNLENLPLPSSVSSVTKRSNHDLSSSLGKRLNPIMMTQIFFLLFLRLDPSDRTHQLAPINGSIFEFLIVFQ
ncbi:hypothetical protein CCACVL1_25326, partial [Corchorus capsularis]